MIIFRCPINFLDVLSDILAMELLKNEREQLKIVGLKAVTELGIDL
jgi:hypothetical protein